MIHYFLALASNLDNLTIIMIAFISYLGICVTSFASRYMKGDRNYCVFSLRMMLLITSLLLMVSSDHLGLLLLTICLSNVLLVDLMIHKANWKAAHYSGMLAAKNYALSSVCLASAFAIFYLNTGESSINTMILSSKQVTIHPSALVLLLVAAMAQSAIWPFHKWLLSSLNSPTPVLAILHAGLINNGGFLLVRFAPLYAQHPKLMTMILLLGIVTTLLGTLWKLMQSDVKKMLACSSISQMGFIFVQCGLGLFTLAVAHLVWHGLFKAYLFLASGSAAQEKRFDLSHPPKFLPFIFALVCGIAASFAFAYASNMSWLAGDSTLVPMVLALLSGSQIALSMLCTPKMRNFLLAPIITIFFELVYGASLHFIAWFMTPMSLMHAQPLSIFHMAAVLIFTLAWLSMLFIRSPSKNDNSPWMLKGYVKALNASQPHPDTITSHHNHYQY